MPLRDYLPEIVLPLLTQTPEDRQFWAGLGDCLDQLAQRARESAQAALLLLCGDDAVAAHGVNFRLERLKTEDAAAHRKVLAARHDHRRAQGSDEELITQIARLGITASVVSWRDLADGGAPTAFGGDPSCWYLQVTVHPFGDPAAWDGGSAWDDGALWDYSDPQGLMGEVERLIAAWKPAETTCRYIQFTLPSGVVMRRPVWDRWEIRPDGSAVNYYNDGY